MGVQILQKFSNDSFPRAHLAQFKQQQTVIGNKVYKIYILLAKQCHLSFIHDAFTYLLKFIFSRKATKFWRNLPKVIWHLPSESKWKISLNLFCLLRKLNFIKETKIICWRKKIIYIYLYFFTTLKMNECQWVYHFKKKLWNMTSIQKILIQ